MRPCDRAIRGAAIVLALAALCGPAAPVEAAGPNIIHILADDLGWGSVGFNGQTKIATPNLDALAASGMKLQNAYSAPVCAPSRAMLYTGFHQGHASVDGNDELSSGFRAQDVMTPQVLAAAGYNSAIIGKWGFGANQSSPPSINAADSLPNRHGFSEFYGFLNHGAAHDYFSKYLWQTNAAAPLGVSTTLNNAGPGGAAQYTHDLFAAKGEQYVAAHAGDASPFYLQVDYTIPHFDLDAVASAPGGYGAYASQAGWTDKEKAYAAMISRMDASVGALMARLDDPNLDGDHSDSVRNDTLVIFTSDNGASPTEDEAPVDFFDANGPFRGGKFESYEGGVHMPAVASWPGVIAPGSTSAYRTDLADFMATAAELAGVEAPVGIDGTSILPTLTGAGHQRQRDDLVFEHQGAHGGDADPRIGRWAIVRQDGMKLIHYDNETQELFNVNTDPGEASPLNLGNAANAQIAAELQANAIAEGVLRGVVEYRTYTGPNGGNVQDDASWDGVGRPHGFWSASIVNAGAASRIAHVTGDVTTLGVEIRGAAALQTVDVHAGSTLSGRNEVRIGAHGRVDLSGGALATNRWVNVRAGGELRGRGTVSGDVYNEGVVSPGRPDDGAAWPIVAPPALPPITLDTGITTATTFNFSGVQDDSPLLATSAKSPYVEVAAGLQFGPGVAPKLGNGGTDAGNEFNVVGQGAASLAAAIAGGDYISFTVDPVAGAGAIPSSVSFRLWRNGGAAAKNYAVLSSVGGFTSSAALVQATYSDTGSGAQHTLTAVMPAVEAVSEPIEYRLYGWGATNGAGNTHINLASLSARFVAVPTLEFDFAGVQDAAPLTALRRSDANLALSAGLTFGPGTAPRGSGNAGAEFNVAGLSTGGTLQSAIDGGDYLAFAVQPVQGMAVYPDSASFTMWRDGAGSAVDYAVMSSVGGFASGQQLATTHQTTIGAANQFTLTGSFVDAQPTTSPVEFRLYGWNAATAADGTHLVGASMRARFASVVGTPIDPTGQLAVQGDFYHLAGGVLAIDLGGLAAGDCYDVVNVSGAVALEGDLHVALTDASGTLFAPAFGNAFQILTADGGVTGQFAEVALPQLAEGLDWFVDYNADNVTLDVMAGADFNRDGSVDAADLALWQAGAGLAAGAAKHDGDANNDGVVDGADFLVWQRQLGMSASFAAAAPLAVPEPRGALIAAGLSLAGLSGSRLRLQGRRRHAR
jgi:arylsulfatase A-like enzyme